MVLFPPDRVMAFPKDFLFWLFMQLGVFNLYECMVLLFWLFLQFYFVFYSIKKYIFKVCCIFSGQVSNLFTHKITQLVKSIVLIVSERILTRQITMLILKICFTYFNDLNICYSILFIPCTYIILLSWVFLYYLSPLYITIKWLVN